MFRSYLLLMCGIAAVGCNHPSNRISQRNFVAADWKTSVESRSAMLDDLSPQLKSLQYEEVVALLGTPNKDLARPEVSDPKLGQFRFLYFKIHDTRSFDSAYFLVILDAKNNVVETKVLIN